MVIRSTARSRTGIWFFLYRHISILWYCEQHWGHLHSSFATRFSWKILWQVWIFRWKSTASLFSRKNGVHPYRNAPYCIEPSRNILCPRLGAEWIGRISWLPRAPLGPIFMTGLLYSVQSIVPTIVLVDLSKTSVPKVPWAVMRSAQFTPLQASDRV